MNDLTLICCAYQLQNQGTERDIMTDKQRIEIFRAHFELDATCPCCEELKKCQDECTFEADALEADAPDRHDAMMAARAILKATA